MRVHGCLSSTSLRWGRGGGGHLSRECAYTGQKYRSPLVRYSRWKFQHICLVCVLISVLVGANPVKYEYMQLSVLQYLDNYIRHTEEMIKQLENAGLGFFVPTSETHEKLGKK